MSYIGPQWEQVMFQSQGKRIAILMLGVVLSVACAANSHAASLRCSLMDTAHVSEKFRGKWRLYFPWNLTYKLGNSCLVTLSSIGKILASQCRFPGGELSGGFVIGATCAIRGDIRLKTGSSDTIAAFDQLYKANGSVNEAANQSASIAVFEMRAFYPPPSLDRDYIYFGPMTMIQVP